MKNLKYKTSCLYKQNFPFLVNVLFSLTLAKKILMNIIESFNLSKNYGKEVGIKNINLEIKKRRFMDSLDQMVQENQLLFERF